MVILNYRALIDQIYERDIPKKADFEEEAERFIRPDCLALSKTQITLRNKTYTIWYADTCVYAGRYLQIFATLEEDGKVDTILFGDLVSGQIVAVDVEGEGRDAKFTFAGAHKGEDINVPLIETSGE